MFEFLFIQLILERANWQCTDINECLQPEKCAGNANCVNLAGSYRCECPKGYYASGIWGCLDINECLEMSTCGGDNEQCVNKPVSFAELSGYFGFYSK